MQVFKFGGTSVGSPQQIKRVAQLILDDRPKIIVLSAVSGTTNKLVTLSTLLKEGKIEEAHEHLKNLKEEYREFVDTLFADSELRKKAHRIVAEHFQTLEDRFGHAQTSVDEKIILAQGELISTNLFQLYLQSLGEKPTLLPALEFMRTAENGEPDLEYSREHLTKLLTQNKSTKYFITQGYICRNAKGAIDNLKRGGSDYTATIIGAVVKAEEIQIWTDIDGLHNNDPRIVDKTFPVRQLSYREAAELAYFGAKILHPTCVIPAEKEGVAIRLKNTFDPEAPGTLISAQTSGNAISAIAAKDGIIAIKIRSGRMLNAYGFLRRVFEVFEEYQTPIDMITTSEVAVSLTVDDPTHVEDICRELKKFGEVSYDTDQTIICIVGDNLNERKGYAKIIFGCLANIPIRMVASGGSKNNVSILVHSDYKKEALKALNDRLF